MGSYNVAGSDLKKMVMAAKKEPVSFGFSPATDDAASYCGMHKTKAPAVIGKEAKDEGEGSKHTFGTASVDGKMMTLTVARELPGLAKKFKKFLKANNVMLNVQIMDEDGNLLDSDVEEGLPDDPELEDGEAPGPGTEGEGGGEGGGPPPDAAALVKRLTALRDRFAGLAPELAGRLGAVLKQAVDLVRAGDLAGAAALADRIEAVLAQAGQGQPQPQTQAEGDLQKLRQAVAVLRDKAGTLADAAARAAILDALGRADGLIGQREAEQALAIIRKVQALLAKAAEGGPGTDPAAEWERRRAALEPQVNQALSQGLVADVDTLRKLWTWAVTNAADGAPDKALAALPRIEAALATLAQGGNAFAEGIAPDAQPFARARVIWTDARARMFGEIRRLEADITAACANDPELAEEVAAAMPMLAGYVEELDTRLTDKMDEIVNAAAGPVRDKLKGEARALIETYRGVLAGEFFTDVDSASGFGSYSVAATASEALGQIEAAIA